MRSRVRTIAMVTAAAVALLTVNVGGLQPSQAASPPSLQGKSLTVATWGGSWTAAFQKWFAKPFAKATGVKFNYVESGIDPNTPVLLQEQAHNVKIDIVDSGLGAELQVHHDLAKFSPSLYSLMKKNSVPGAANPYWWTYGTVPNLIVCNPRIVKRCPKTPKQFWDVKHYPGNRMLTTDPREMAVFALEAAGVSHNRISHNPPLGKAMSMLRKIKPHVKVWASSGSQQQQTMANGDAGIAVMWESRLVPMVTGKYSYLKAYWTGAESESDFAFLVPKGAPDQSVAFAFLRWIALHQKNQAGFSTELGTFTPGKNVMKYVKPKLVTWMPQSHASSVFYWPSLWYVQHANKLKNDWQSTVG